MPFAAIGAAIGISGTAAAGLTAGAIGLGGELLSSSNASDATTQAAKIQADAAAQANALQKQEFDTTQANLQPYMGAGTNALTAYQKALGLGAGGNGQIDPSAFHGSPGFKFQMDQGTEAINNSAAARGGVNSGNTLKALQTFGQGIANQDWYSYLGQLSGLAGSGQNAAAGLGGLGADYAGAVGGNLAGAANANSAGLIANANTSNNSLNSILSQFTGNGGSGLKSAFGSMFGSPAGGGDAGNFTTYGGYNVGTGF